MEIKDLKIIDKNELDYVLKELSDLEGHFDNLDGIDIYRSLVKIRYKLSNL